ncbi:protein of unknown function [Moritella yayanosii]|uniref:Uncharacterized protein n=1 Tax=Moritella yayanosii TaxID=69539 RepID=A0A330LRZ5_9GAMM|nr:protein of unknown function [Moritella yayanosii]
MSLSSTQAINSDDSTPISLQQEYNQQTSINKSLFGRFGYLIPLWR